MKRVVSFTLATIGAAMVIVAVAQGGTFSRSHRQSTHVLVSIRKTVLGSILVDARGRTLYLFEKDRNGLRMCNGACVAYWPPLTSNGTPRAGRGVQKTLLAVTAARNGVRQVVYAGHPLYTFVGDKRPGQTRGEGLTNFGGGWYAIAANGKKVDTGDGSSGSDSGSGSQGGYGSGSGW